MLNPRNVLLSHEDLFIQRYPQLLGWSLQLNGHDRDQAEDLVQDAFVHFTLVRPNLSVIQNLEGYLYTILRNLHISRVRRAAVSRTSSLSMVDYDSAEIGLQASDPWAQFQVREELRTICHYACFRKDAAKSASVLLLRFFHGYYPGEISRILRSPRRAVDDLMRLARREARFYLDNPRPLSLRRKNALAEIWHFNSEQTTRGFLNDLRRAIFRSRRGDCLSAEQLKETYGAPEREPVDCKDLAHIVSCQRCLDEINCILGLPPLSDRYPTDMTGTDSPPDLRPGGGAGSREGPQSLLLRKARDVFEHRPEELHISINGFIVGSQVVSSGLSDQIVSTTTSERISFVEVLSEQGLRLLLLDVEPTPGGQVEQQASVELSEGRTLDLSVSFSNAWPKVRVVYRDPLLTERNAANYPATERWQVRLTNDRVTAHGPRRPGFFVRLWQSLAAPDFWLRPGLQTAVGALILITVLAILRFATSSASASEILLQAVQFEATTRESDLVTHRIFNLEERRGPGGALVSRHKVEVWFDGQKALKAHRVFDDNDQIVAAEWTDTDGSKTVYRRGVPNRSTGAENGSLLDRENIWRLEPSATDFSQLVAETKTATVEKRSSAYVIDYRSGLETALVRASLTLNRPDLHAIEQVLVVRQGHETREYRFVEIGFERRPIDSVAPTVFQPDPGLATVPAAVEIDVRRGNGIDSPVIAPGAPGGKLNARLLAGLEAEALYQLHSVGACLRHQISLERTEEGELHIQAIVDTDSQKLEIIEALRPVAGSLAAKIEVSTIAEALKEHIRLPPRQAAVRTVEIRRGQFPVFADLKAHFSESSPGSSAGQVDEEVRRFASRALNQSRRALLHAWALNELRQQLSADDLRVLSPETEAKWRSMVGDHARSFLQETRALRLELQPVFFEGVSDGEESGAVLDISRAIKRLFEMASHHEHAMRTAFTISAAGSTASPIRTEAFFHSLRNAERLAARIQSDG